MKRRPGIGVGRFHQPFGIVFVKAKDVFVGEAENTFASTIAANRVEQFEKRFLPLAADDVVYIAGIQRGIGVNRRKISTPDDWQLRVLLFNFLASRDRCGHLRPGHHGHSQEFDIVLPNQVENRFRGIVVHVAIHNLIFFAAFQNGCEGHHRERKAAIARFCGAGIEEHNHLVFTWAA